MPHELPNDLRLNLRILGKIRKISNLELQTSAQSSCQNKIFSNTGWKLLKSRNQTFPLGRYFTWNLEFVSNILWMMEDCDETKTWNNSIKIWLWESHRRNRKYQYQGHITETSFNSENKWFTYRQDLPLNGMLEYLI